MTPRLALVLGALLAGLIPVAAPGVAAAGPERAAVQNAEDGSIEIQLLEAPASRRDDPRALSYVVDHLNPGDSIERRFAVTNHTATRQRVQLYAGPAEIRDGEFVGGDPGTANELTSWVSTSLPRVGLAPGESSEQTVRVDVPSDASEGERYAVLWASVRSHGSGDVRMVNRVGIRIYLDVGPGGEPRSDFSIDEITPGRDGQGRPTLSAAVTNTGGRAIDVRGQVRLRRGPGGLNAGPFDVGRGATLAPGDTGSVDLTLDRSLPAGPWRAKLDLHSGQVRHRAAATVTFPSSGAGSAVEARAEDPQGATSWTDGPWPWVLAVVLALLLGLALLLLARRRRSGAKDPSAALP